MVAEATLPARCPRRNARQWPNCLLSWDFCVLARTSGPASGVAEGCSGRPCNDTERQLRGRRRDSCRGAGPAPTARRARWWPCRRRDQRDTLNPVETVLSVLQVVIAVVVIFLVLMHSGKDSGLSGAFGVGSGTGPLGGGSLVERNLNRWTIFFAVLFFVNAIVLLKRPWA